MGRFVDREPNTGEIGSVVEKAQVCDSPENSLFKVELSSPMLLHSLTGTALVNMSTSRYLQTDVKEEQHRCDSPELEAGPLFRDGVVPGDTRGGSRTGESEAEERLRSLSTSSSRLFAQLKATEIKESVMTAAIERFGGGEKGLRGAVKAIMVWVVEKNRYLAQSSHESEIDDPAPWENVLAMAMPSGGEQSNQSLWGNAAIPDQGNAAANQFAAFESCNHLLSDPDEGSCLTSAMSGSSDGWWSLADLKFDGGSGDHGEVVDKLGFQDGDLLGELEQESGSATNDIPATPSNCWTASSNSSDTLRRSLVRKSSPTLSSGCDGDIFEGTCCNQSNRNKIQRRVTRSSSAPVCEGQSIFGSSEANVFVPFLPVMPNSIDPLFMDMSSFTSFDMRSPISLEDLSKTSPVLGSRLYSLGSMDVQQISTHDCTDTENQGTIVEPEAATTASIRLARKKRIHSNRKAASKQFSGYAGSRGMRSRTMCNASSSSTSSVERPARSKRLPIDREGAKYLLEKKLKPSDVGSLSRIILPKRDAEKHLPSLFHKEGIPFDCEDYITGETVAFRYRFWPNNKSRMYVLENTGGYIRRHQLRVDDSIAMYQNEEDGKFLIRPRKARDGQEPRPRVRNGKQMYLASSSENLARSASSSLDRSLSDISVSSNIVTSANSKAALEPVVMASVSPASPAEDALLSSVQSVDMPDAQIKNTTDKLLSTAHSVDIPDAAVRNGTNTLFKFPTLEAFDAELFA